MRSHAFALFLAIVLASTFASPTQATTPNCAAFSAALAREAGEEAVSIAQRMTPEEKLVAARALHNSQAPIDPGVLMQLMMVLGLENYAAAREEFQLNNTVQTLSLDGTNDDFAARWAMLRKVDGSNPQIAQLLSLSHSGARALAFRTLENKPLFGANSSHMLRTYEKEGKVHGLTAAELTALLGKGARTPELAARIKKNDDFWKLLFEGSPELYDNFAHSPAALAYIAYRHRGLSDPNGRGKMVEEMLDNTIEQTPGMTTRAKLDEFLKTRLAAPGVAVAVDAHIKGVRQGSGPTFKASGKTLSLDTIAEAYGVLGGSRKPVQVQYTEAIDRLAQVHFGDKLATTSLRPQDVLHQPDIQHAVHMFLRGHDKEAGAALEKFFEGPGKDLQLDVKKLIASGAIAASKDIAIQRAFTAMANGGSPIEEAMLVMAGETNDHTMLIDGHKAPVMNVRPQQVEMARAVLQYGDVTKDSKILEIGYGTPSVLGALNLVAPGKTTGVDLISVPQLPALATAAGPIQLLQGNPTTDAATDGKVKAGGPYQVVFGGDVFKGSFNPGVTKPEYLKWVHSQLAEGGVMMGLNDYGKPLAFTKEELTAAGFEVVRWNATREVPGAVKTLFQNNLNVGAEFGDMRLFVVRKGKFNAEKYRPGAAK